MQHNTSRSALALTVLTGAVLLGTAACSSSAGSTAAGGASVSAPASATASATASAGAPASGSASASTPAAGTASTQDTGAAVGTAAGSPSASEGYPVDLQPANAAPGAQVMVYGLTCSASTGTATSPAFTGKVALSMLSDATGGAATVKPGLAAGSYPVTVECGSITVTGTLTVS